MIIKNNVLYIDADTADKFDKIDENFDDDLDQSLLAIGNSKLEHKLSKLGFQVFNIIQSPFHNYDGTDDNGKGTVYVELGYNTAVNMIKFLSDYQLILNLGLDKVDKSEATKTKKLIKNVLDTVKLDQNVGSEE